jgi:hypothetical protein
MEHTEENGQHTLEYDCECSLCRGTGLYVGLAERDGAAVVCHTCKGTGQVKRKIVWRDFTGRKPRGGVLRVFENNPGICIGGGKDKQHALSDFGGMPHDEWEAGNPFPPESENRRFTCPAWWYQSVDYEKKPKWDTCIGCGSFSGCKHFGNKEACWARWDAEFTVATASK